MVALDFNAAFFRWTVSGAMLLGGGQSYIFMPILLTNDLGAVLTVAYTSGTLSGIRKDSLILFKEKEPYFIGVTPP